MKLQILKLATEFKVQNMESRKRKHMGVSIGHLECV